MQGDAPDWHLLCVEVIEEESAKSTLFVCNKWIGLTNRNEDGSEPSLQRTFKPSDYDPRTDVAIYKVGDGAWVSAVGARIAWHGAEWGMLAGWSTMP